MTIVYRSKYKMTKKFRLKKVFIYCCMVNIGDTLNYTIFFKRLQLFILLIDLVKKKKKHFFMPCPATSPTLIDLKTLADIVGYSIELAEKNLASLGCINKL